MATVKELLNDLAKKAGVDQTSDDFKMLLAASSLGEVEVPDSIVNGLGSGLMNKGGAMNHSEVKTHFQTLYANNLENKFFPLLAELGATQEEIDALKTNHSGFGNRLPESKAIFERLISDAKKKPAGDANAEHLRVLNELKQSFSQKESEYKTQLEGLKTTMRNRDIDQAFEKHFGKLAIKGISDPVVKKAVLTAKLNEWNQRDGAVVEYDEALKDFKLLQAANKDLEYTQEGTKYSFPEYFSLNLQKDSLLDANPGGSGNGNGRQNIIPIPENGNGAAKSLEQKVEATNQLFKM
jgi:hypothetical protein